MAFSPELAEIRFGCGLSPVLPAPPDADAMLAGLQGPDTMADRYPIEDFDTYNDRVLKQGDLARQRRDETDDAARMELRESIRQASRDANMARGTWAARTCLRWSRTDTGFRERLVAFWADHFTAIGKSALLRYASSSFVESAIRPHVAGTFADMLIAATTHPVMMDALDQLRSAGPNSPIVAKRGRVQGLNENLAREVMELHTLGVDGPYTQADVRELAKLLTGITYRPRLGTVYLKDWAEPGAETVLGQTYSAEPSIDNVHAALTDLAQHPATARHLARKLAVHFVSDSPDPDLVAHIEARYTATKGDLMATYAAMLDHPAAWDPRPANVKPPLDFMASAFRALAMQDEPIGSMPFPHLRLRIFVPLSLMGQPWRAPIGPDGWPEDDAAWVTPQSVSARMRWAMEAPQRFCPDLPDPRDFVDSALGPFVTEPVRFAARAAESRSEAIGLVLSAPAFQRR